MSQPPDPGGDTDAGTPSMSMEAPPAPASHGAGGPGDSPPPAAEPQAAPPPMDEDFGPPFAKKSFGGAFVWAKTPEFVATVLRLRAGKSVPIATAGRRGMTVMLTGGRAVLEVTGAAADGGPSRPDRVELLPAAPVEVHADRTYRLLSLTEVEIFTVYAPEP